MAVVLLHRQVCPICRHNKDLRLRLKKPPAAWNAFIERLYCFALMALQAHLHGCSEPPNRRWIWIGYAPGPHHVKQVEAVMKLLQPGSHRERIGLAPANGDGGDQAVLLLISLPPNSA